MEPGLRDGDWLLVDPLAFAGRAPRVGELVVARDPRSDGRLIVKRVRSLEAAGTLTVGGDHAAHTDESVTLEPAKLIGRPWWRYWPAKRMGRIT